MPASINSAIPPGQPHATQNGATPEHAGSLPSCRIDQQTGQILAAGPFRHVSCERFRLEAPFLPASQCIAEVAVR